jgi:hypothetical protein
VVALVAVGAGVFLVTNKSDSGGSLKNDGKKYKLVTPGTVLGSYTKDSNTSGDGFDDSDIAKMKTLGASNLTKISATYRNGSGLTAKELEFSGAYGTISDPKKLLDGMFAELAKQAKEGGSDDSGTKSELVGSPQMVSPAGLDDGLMECQTAKTTEKSSGKSIEFPLCLWADYTTVGSVLSVDMSMVATGGKGEGTDQTATKTANVRKEVRVPLS